MTIDRVEHELAELRKEVSDLNAAISNLAGRFENVSNVHDTIEGVRRDLAEHETHDAAVQATLQTEVRRLWWLVSAAGLTGAAGAGSGLAALLGAG